MPPPGSPPYGGQPQYPAPQQYPGPSGPGPGQPYPGLPPGGGPPPKRKARTGVSITIALVLVAAAGAWFVTNSGGDGDNEKDGQPSGVAADTPGGQVWAVDEGNPESERARGMWVVPDADAVVKAGLNTLVSYSLADGSVNWTVELEGEHLCVPSSTAADGRVVVGHGEKNCGQNITMVDLTTGEQGWSERLEPQEDPTGFQIAMAGDSYAIHTHGGWNLHRIEDAEVISALRAPYHALQHRINESPYGEPQDVEDGDEICAADGIAGGEILVRRLSCAMVHNREADALSEPFYKLQQIDPANDDVLWTVELPEGKWLDKVHSVEPLVVSFRSGEFDAISDLAVVKDGQITAQFPLGNTGVAESDSHLTRDQLCRGGIVPHDALDDCAGFVAHGEVLYASPVGRNGPVTALDLATGEPLWAHETEDFVGQLVLAADDDGVIVLQRGYTGEPSQVVRLSPDGQTAVPLFRLGNEEEVYTDFFTAFHADRLYVSATDYSLDDDLAVFGADGETEAPAEPSEE
jgi:outer membrane protein assembly factor BamB